MNTHPVHTEIRGKGKKEGWEEGNKDDRRKKEKERRKQRNEGHKEREGKCNHQNKLYVCLS